MYVKRGAKKNNTQYGLTITPSGVLGQHTNLSYHNTSGLTISSCMYYNNTQICPRTARKYALPSLILVSQLHKNNYYHYSSGVTATQLHALPSLIWPVSQLQYQGIRNSTIVPYVSPLVSFLLIFFYLLVHLVFIQWSQRSERLCHTHSIAQYTYNPQQNLIPWNKNVTLSITYTYYIECEYKDVHKHT